MKGSVPLRVLLVAADAGAPERWSDFATAELEVQRATNLAAAAAWMEASAIDAVVVDAAIASANESAVHRLHHNTSLPLLLVSDQITDVRDLGGGRIVIRSVRQNGHAIIEVEDDGLGMTEDRLDTALTDGIGLSNVNERLSVIYGATYRVRITSVANLGTIIRLEIPDMVSAERITA